MMGHYTVFDTSLSLSFLEAEISVKSILHSKVPLFHTNALTAVKHCYTRIIVIVIAKHGTKKDHSQQTQN